MLRSMKDLEGYVLEATDGEIGRCRDFLFSDRQWVVRYMVADTGKWLPGKKVLVSPISLGGPDWQSRHFPVMLTKEEIETSPEIDHAQPVSRQYEAELFAHLGYLPCWGGTSLWGESRVPRHSRVSELEDSAGVTVAVELTRRQIENSPESEPGAPVDRAYEARLYDYYGRPVYWD